MSRSRVSGRALCVERVDEKGRAEASKEAHHLKVISQALIRREEL